MFLLSVTCLDQRNVEHIKVDRLLSGVCSNDVPDLLDSSETREVVVNLQRLGFISGSTLVTTVAPRSYRTVEHFSLDKFEFVSSLKVQFHHKTIYASRIIRLISCP